MGAFKKFHGITENVPEEVNLIRDVLVPGDVYECTGDVMRDDGNGNLYFVKRAGDNFRYVTCNARRCLIGQIKSSDI